MKKETQPANVKLIGEATDEQIAEWKKKYPLGIYAIKSQGHIAYFKDPDIDECNAILSAKGMQPLDMVMDIAGTTFIGGSAEIKDDLAKHKGAVIKLREILDGKPAELVNL
jgi:hypothetical protein